MAHKIKIECPTHFFKHSLDGFEIVENGCATILVANPGSSYMYDANYLCKFEHLKILATPSTGVTHIDLSYCIEKNIKVLTLLEDRPSLNNIHASAEFTWMLILSVVRNFTKALEMVRNAKWRDVEDELRGEELHGKTIGIVGLGRIGSKIAKFATAFGMNVIYYDPDMVVDTYTKVHNILDIAEQSDIISLNCYLTPATTGMIDDIFIRKCKNGAAIINTSRGEVVKEEDVVAAVIKGKIRYATDVVQNEQNLNAFYSSNLYRCFQSGYLTITPHIAGATIQSQSKAFVSLIGIINQYLSTQQNV